MITSKLKKIQNTMLNVQNQLDVAINKLNGDHDEQRLAHMLSETRKVLTSAIEESKNFKTTEPVQAPSKKKLAAIAKEKRMREYRYGLPLPDTFREDEGQNTKCRHYCGDYCSIGMDMTFCSKRCAYCTNMPGFTKAAV